VRATCLILALAACGRIGFDTSSRRDDAGASDAASPDAAEIPPGPRIWLRMETDPTTGIIDSAGNHEVTCAVGGCPMRVAGIHGSGYAFTDQEVDVANAADLDSSGGFTAAIWLRLDAFPTDEACLWTKSFDNANGYDTFTLCIGSDGTAIFDGETPGGSADAETGPQLALGTWHHLALSWDGTTKRGYVDGVNVVTVEIQLGAGTEPLALGGSRSSYFVQGTVDDALYYTRALSAAEVTQLATP
jgi:hypothetical protein